MSEPATSGSRTEQSRAPAWLFRSRVGPLQRALAVAAAVLLGIDAYVHLHDAHFYNSVTSSTISEGNLFRTQAIVAVVVAVALLDVGGLGPLPDLYEPTWIPPGKLASAVAEGLGTLLAVMGFVVSLRTHLRSRHVRD